MRIFIDDRPCEAQPGQYVLEVARAHGIEIPALCHHDALPYQACCRLCLVDVVAGGGVGAGAERHAAVVSCTYPVYEGLQVYTQTDEIRRLRRMILGLLREAAPAADGLLADLYAEYEVPDYALRFNVLPDEKCVLCGLCVKACEELGTCAIQGVQRGIDKLVSTPFGEPALTCVGCASCARVCPTGAIDCVEAGDTRTIWDKTFTLQRCAACGALYATPEELEWLKGKLEDLEFNEEYCPACRGRVFASAQA